MDAHLLMITIVGAWLVVAAVVFVALFFVTAPYGRHVREGWGPTLPNRYGWLVMEAPSALVFGVGFALGPYNGTITAWVFLLMWESHYVYRAFVYPFTLEDDGRRMPLSVVGMAMAFNVVNAGLNSWWLFDLSGGYPAEWLADPRFVAGLLLFVAGMLVNRRSDATLRALRAAGTTGAAAPADRSSAPDAGGSRYRIPEGGLYRWVSCPNYLGEVVEWAGWAVATWSLPGLAFAVWTAANLVPRARAHHEWYRRNFPDYPAERKALIPAVW